MKSRQGERKRERTGLRQSFPRVLHHLALAFYWNIKGEADLQRHIVKPVTPITKALKWVEDGEEEQEEAENCGAWGGVDGEWGRQGTWGYNRGSKVCVCVCRWLRGNGWESHSTTSNHNFWGTAERSWWAGQVEGNRIDTGMRRRMLGTSVLREAEGPRGDVKTLVNSTVVQTLICEFIYFNPTAGWRACWLYSCPSCWAWLVRVGRCDWHSARWTQCFFVFTPSLSFFFLFFLPNTQFTVHCEVLVAPNSTFWHGEGVDSTVLPPPTRRCWEVHAGPQLRPHWAKHNPTHKHDKLQTPGLGGGGWEIH